MKITTISDTHNKHRQIKNIPYSDILIHAGDISSQGQKHEVESFISWFKSQSHPYKIFIAGNHDLSFVNKEEWLVNILNEYQSDPNNYYLENNGCEIEGVKFWGSPATPTFHNWAFNYDRGAAIKVIWDLIPYGTNVLITHGPAAYILDYAGVTYTGCEALRYKIKQVKPLLHICGHIHESRGIYQGIDTLYVNTSICNMNYSVANEPFLLDMNLEEKIIKYESKF